MVSQARSLDFRILALLFLLTFLLYFPVHNFSFVSLDDGDYGDSPHVRAGFTRESVVWALTSGEASNWFPVTRLSHLLDGQLFGTRSGMHHVMNVVFHGIATLLLYAFLRLSTGAVWRSASVALIFAIHPLHVESVAWVAERKDVLCACFWFLTLCAWVRYTAAPGARRYLLVMVSFLLGLMSKPMIVTLPFVLLLLDWWPLKRLPGLPWRRAVLEKAPLLVLSAAASAITYATQLGAASGTGFKVDAPLGLRIENAAVSYVVYIAKMFWPTRLAVLYPYPSHVEWWQFTGAVSMIVAVTWFAARKARTQPFLIVGWLWFLGTLVPVIGLVQVGVQSRADRYMYIPMVGLSIMLAWGLAEGAQHWTTRAPAVKPLVATAAVIALILAGGICRMQLEYWRDSETLYRRALAVTERNAMVHYFFGIYLGRIPSRSAEAVVQYRAAIATDPNLSEAHNNLGGLYVAAHLPSAAESEFEQALQLKPSSAGTHNNLGAALEAEGRIIEAMGQYEEALRLDPSWTAAHYNLARILSRIPDRAQEAVPHLRAVLQHEPDPENRREAETMLSHIRAENYRLPRPPEKPPL